MNYKILLTALLTLLSTVWAHAQFDHGKPVTDVAFAPDGSILASISFGNIYLWDGETHFEARQIEEKVLNTLFAVDISANSELMAVANRNNIMLYNLKSGRMLSGFSGHSRFVFDLAFHPNSNILASASQDKKVKVWDLSSGNELFDLSNHSAEVNAVAFSSDGSMLASGSSDGTLSFWGFPGARLLGSVSNVGKVQDISFSKDGKSILAANDQGQVVLVDVSSLTVTKRTQAHNGVVFSVVAIDKTTFASGGEDKLVKIWNYNDSNPSFTISTHTNRISGLVASPDGKQLVSSSYDNLVRVWDPKSGKELSPLKDKTNDVRDLKFHAGTGNLFSVYQDGSLKIHNPKDGELVKNVAKAHSVRVNTVSFSPDGTIVATGAEDGLVKLWDVESGNLKSTLGPEGKMILHTSFSPDGKFVAAGNSERSIKIWNVQSGREFKTLTGHFGDVRRVLFSPQPGIMASLDSNKRTFIWNYLTGAKLATIEHDDYINDGDFVENGKYLLVSTFQKIEIFETASGKKVGELTGQSDWINDIAISPDGTKILSCSANKSIFLWDWASKSKVREFPGHTSYVNIVDFSKSGDVLASGSYDGTIRFWNVNTGKNFTRSDY